MPADSFREHFVWEPSGRALFDGHDLAELAENYPTPFYLISEGQLRDNYRRLRRAFSGVEGLRTYYSIKSNFESIVLRTLASEGCGGEISGALDLELVRRAGIPADHVVFDGPCKTTADLEDALAWGIHLINLESLTEARLLERIAAKLGRVVKVGMRVDPLLSKPYYDKVITTYKKKFGLPLDQAVDAACEIDRMPHLELVGLMTHIGSQVFTPQRYLAALDRLFKLIGDLADHGIEIVELNLGGGYPAQSMRNLRLSRRFVVARLLERMNRIEVQAKSIDDFGQAIGERYHALASETGYKPTLALEPGRCLVSNAGMVVGRIRVIKNDWLFTDISINDVPENLFFSEWRLVVPGQKPDSRGRQFNVAGSTLATQDVLYFKREVPGAAEGSPIAVLDTGAYCIARANQFTRPRSAAYAIREDRSIEVVRRAESVEDVLSTQIWPDLGEPAVAEPAEAAR